MSAFVINSRFSINCIVTGVAKNSQIRLASGGIVFASK